jgi:hypothetical protein
MQPAINFWKKKWHFAIILTHFFKFLIISEFYTFNIRNSDKYFKLLKMFWLFKNIQLKTKSICGPTTLLPAPTQPTDYNFRSMWRPSQFEFETPVVNQLQLDSKHGIIRSKMVKLLFKPISKWPFLWMYHAQQRKPFETYSN